MEALEGRQETSVVITLEFSGERVGDKGIVKLYFWSLYDFGCVQPLMLECLVLLDWVEHLVGASAGILIGDTGIWELLI